MNVGMLLLRLIMNISSSFLHDLRFDDDTNVLAKKNMLLALELREQPMRRKLLVPLRGLKLEQPVACSLHRRPAVACLLEQPCQQPGTPSLLPHVQVDHRAEVLIFIAAAAAAAAARHAEVLG
jgi:hypothetical protein